MGYLLIALFTDLIFEMYKPELERLERCRLVADEAIISCKKRMFQDLVPISDDYVLYTDYAEYSKTSVWNGMLKAMKSYLNM